MIIAPTAACIMQVENRAAPTAVHITSPRKLRQGTRISCSFDEACHAVRLDYSGPVGGTLDSSSFNVVWVIFKVTGWCLIRDAAWVQKVASCSKVN